MVLTSLKSTPETFLPTWLPEKFLWSNYVEAIKKIPFFRQVLNTVFLVVVNIIGVVGSCSLVAYAFGRLRWPGRDVWFVILLATLMLPGQVTMIPLFIVYKHIGWLNTYLPLTVPAFFGGGATNIFLMRQFYRTIPFEMTESARVDGANEFIIYSKIILPLCKPILATITIFTFN